MFTIPLLILSIVTFLGAMILYAVVLIRLKRMVTYFDLPALAMKGNKLAQASFWLWNAAIALAIGFGISRLI
jgi:hypothetical protein